MKLGIVILNWNGEEMLRRFLPSVIEHSPEAEVVVADNGSSDGSLKLMAEQFPYIRTLVFDRNYGFAEGYNKAIAEVECDLCLLLNSDVRVEEGWLRPMLDYMKAHPEVAACQPKIRCEWAPDMLEYAGACGGYIDRLGFPFCRGRILGTVERDEGQYDSIASVAWATGAALLIRRDVYLEAGGLDARFFAHQEEIDLCWRLRSRGYKIACIPESVVYHVGGGTLPKESPQKAYLNFRIRQGDALAPPARCGCSAPLPRRLPLGCLQGCPQGTPRLPSHTKRLQGRQGQESGCDRRAIQQDTPADEPPLGILRQAARYIQRFRNIDNQTI